MTRIMRHAVAIAEAIAVVAGFCAVVIVVGATAGCAPPEGRVVKEAGVRLVDANASGLTYFDRTGALWFLALDGAAGAGDPQKIAEASDHVEDALMPAQDAGVVVAFAGIDAATGIAAHAIVREASGDVHALGDGVTVAQVKASPDGKHVYHEEPRGTAEAGNEALFLDGELLLSTPKLAHKEKARFTVDGILVLGVDIVDPELDTVTSAVLTYEDAHTPHRIATLAANATAVTHDGAFVIYGAHEDGPLVDLEMQPILGGDVIHLTCAPGAPTCSKVSDARIKVTPDDSEVFVLADGALVSIALDGAHARATRTGDAVDIIAVSDSLVVTASAVDAVTGAMSLVVAEHPALPGSPEQIGGGAADVDDALDVGMSADGAHYFFLGDRQPIASAPGASAAASAAVKLAGTLGVYGGNDAGATDDVAASVRKAKPIGGGVAWLDDGDRLFVRTLAADGKLGERRLVQINVDRFQVAGTELAYSVRAEENAGIWIVQP